MLNVAPTPSCLHIVIKCPNAGSEDVAPGNGVETNYTPSWREVALGRYSINLRFGFWWVSYPIHTISQSKAISKASILLYYYLFLKGDVT
jgi:hypothetical protein